MTTDVISNALGQQLEAANLGHKIVWENQKLPSAQARPYLVFEYVPASRRDRSLKGGSPITRGFVQITVVSKRNKFATVAKQIAESVAAVFDRSDPAKAIITSGGLKITLGDTFVAKGFPDDLSWRTPVRINFTAMKA